MANVKAIVSLTLTADNYPLWSSQVSKLLKANGYDGFLDGTNQCPIQFLSDTAGLSILNPNYQQWQLVDQNLSAALAATISPSILPYIINLSSTAEIWETLLKRLQATNRSRVIQLKNELYRVSLKNNSITQYLSEVKALVDQIAAAGAHLDNEDIILHILNGLPPTYQAFKTAIRTRAGDLHLDDLYSMLISEEIHLTSELNREISSPTQALYSARGRGRSNYSRGRGRSSPTNSNPHRPYTPEQNGVAERKHRHLIETTRTLLLQAHLPYNFWVDALLTALYLINLLPSSNTNMLFPFELLHQKPPPTIVISAPSTVPASRGNNHSPPTNSNHALLLVYSLATRLPLKATAVIIFQPAK